MNAEMWKASLALSDHLKLTRLTPTLGEAYLAMVDEFVDAGEGYPYNNIPLARADTAAFVRELEEEERGIGLPPGIVPQTTYILVRDDGTVLGEIRYRPATEPPFAVGHDHLAYNVRPSERRRGYASIMLSRVLDEARHDRLDGVSLTVEGDNPASMHLMQKFGGQVLQAVANPDIGETVTLYWISL